MSLAFAKKLDESWKLALVDDEQLAGEVRCAADLAQYAPSMLDAQVPGDWPLDYVRSGLMEDPYFADNYLRIRDFENSHVFYALRFEWTQEPDERTFLRFEGIDTVADVYLNGKCVGHAEDMYIPHEFAAEGIVRGENELLVHIRPVALEARKYPIALRATTLQYNYEALVIRKATHMFGWDICPRIVTSGLWRPVSVIQRKAERVADAFVWLENLRSDGSAHVRACYDVDIGRRHVKDYAVRIEGVCGDSRFETTRALWYVHGNLDIAVENPRLWWPAGYGDANLYDVTVTLLKNGEPVDALTRRVGLRKAELACDAMTDDEGNGDFCFIINGRRIYIKGTNWVPADAFHSNDANRIPKILPLVKDIGCNAMRVWGGGVYESDFFYDWCDENGIIIWQDFMMACGVYPHSQRMQTQLREEAETIVRRLRQHACICLWAGDNECDQNYCWFDHKIDPGKNVLNRKILPDVVWTEDGTRPYLPSSPYVSPEAFRAGRVEQTPEQHLWGPRNYYKSAFYHDHNATFASEMGYHGCNSPASIRRFIPEAYLWPETDNAMWQYHAASPEANGAAGYAGRIRLMSSQIRYLFAQQPQSLDEYAHMSQINQAEAKKYFVESFRSRKGKRTGLIWWNLMDCWPQFSDAVVDYYFCRKLAYFFIRRSQEPVCLMMDDQGGRLALYGVSDRFEPVSVRYTVRDVAADRIVLSGESILAADASTRIWNVDDDGAQRFYLIEWETADGVRGRNHYLQGAPLFDYGWYMDCLKRAGLDEFEGF